MDSIINQDELCTSTETADLLLNKCLLHHNRFPMSIKFIELSALQSKINEQLLNKYLTADEKKQYQFSQTPLNFIAKRIAAKIAFFEIYTGETKLRYNQITVEHDTLGCPYFCAKGRVSGYVLSISDEVNTVAVFCGKTSF